MKLNLNAQEILEKEFNVVKSKLEGYDRIDVDEFLDLVIQDYMKIEKILIRIKELEIENQNLKIKNNALKNMNREQEISGNQVNNIDILKRLSRLEQAIFGQNN